MPAKAKKTTTKKTAKKTTKKEVVKKAVAAEESAVAAEATTEQEKEKETAKNHFVLMKTDDKTGKWYVLHTYSGHENSVAINMMQRVKTMKLDGRVLEILIPTQNKIQIKRGKKTSIKEKIFPGYMLVKLVLDDETWLAVRTTPGVTGFVGVGSKPTPLPPNEVASIKKFMEQEAPKYKATFSVGEAVKIVEGPFADFLGTVDHIDEAKGKVHVLVSIFGRETPVELDFLQVSKI
jgi:transcriptional antiterminator NusG